MSRNARKDTDPTGISESEASLAGSARSFLRLCYRWGSATPSSTVLVSMSIYPPSPRRNGDWLVVAKGFDQGYRLAAFQRSPNPLTALIGILSKIADGSVQWKEDTYASTSGEWLKR